MWSEGAALSGLIGRSTGNGRSLLDKAKPFCIPKRWVWEAYKRVKRNRGAAGVDEQSIEEFEVNLKGNLYKLWNRMSSGSYFPPPVKRVEIAKREAGTRLLGVPTVADRIAQAVVKAYLEPELEKHFHPDSYGYRPRKSALDAVGVHASAAGAKRGCSIWISAPIWTPLHNAPWFMISGQISRVGCLSPGSLSLFFVRGRHGRHRVRRSLHAATRFGGRPQRF